MISLCKIHGAVHLCLKEQPWRMAFTTSSRAVGAAGRYDGLITSVTFHRRSRRLYCEVKRASCSAKPASSVRMTLGVGAILHNPSACGLSCTAFLGAMISTYLKFQACSRNTSLRRSTQMSASLPDSRSSLCWVIAYSTYTVNACWHAQASG